MIAKLHYITQPVAGKSIQEVVRATCKGGTKWVQIRIKDQSQEVWKQEALLAQQICKEYGAKCIINDNVLLAKEIGADGIHIGKQDMPPQEARAILGNDVIIGGTANDMEDIKRLAAAKVDYIGLGPLRFTSTKKNLSPILGLEGYQTICDECKTLGIDIPIIAIGGITPEDIQDLLKTGVHGIAISSGINLSENPSLSTQTFLNHL